MWLLNLYYTQIHNWLWWNCCKIFFSLYTLLSTFLCISFTGNCSALRNVLRESASELDTRGTISAWQLRVNAGGDWRTETRVQVSGDEKNSDLNLSLHFWLWFFSWQEFTSAHNWLIFTCGMHQRARSKTMYYLTSQLILFNTCLTHLRNKF